MSGGGSAYNNAHEPGMCGDKRCIVPRVCGCPAQESIMADDFTMKEDGGTKTYSKQGGTLADVM